MVSNMAVEVSHRKIWALAFPVILSNATVPVLGLVDTAVVGQIASALPIAAVGIGSVFITAIYWLFGFLRMGTVGLTAQAEGAGDQAEVVAMLMRVLGIAFIGGILTLALQGAIFNVAFWLSPASTGVEALAREYLSIRIWSAPAMIAIYGISGWMIARADTKSVLIVQVTMNLINIGLDFLFVMGFGWGVAGVAWGSFIAEWSGLLIGLWLCRAAFRDKFWCNWEGILTPQRIVKLARVNGDIFLRTLLLQVVLILFMLRGARYGDEILAVNQVLIQFVYITSYALDGFAFAAEALVGQAIGAKAVFKLRRAIKFCLLWSGFGGAVLALCFWLGGPFLIDLISADEQVRQVARGFLVWMVLGPLLGWVAWMLDGAFIGAAETRSMRDAMIVTFLLYLLLLFPLELYFSNHGLWAALSLSFVIRAITLGRYYPRLEALVR